MDLGGIGSYQVPDILTSAGMAGYGGAPAAAGEDFSRLLENNLRRMAEENPAPSGRQPVVDKESKLYETCLELEGFLLKTLLSSMRSTVQKSGLIDEGFAGKMYEDMLYDEYTKEFTKNANFGLAEMAYLELTNQRGRVISGQQR
jgi:flagellar protein FlgJ